MGWFMLFSSQELLEVWSLEAPYERARKRTANGRPERSHPTAGSEQLHLWERSDTEAAEEVTEGALRAPSEEELTD